jgi:hypothetical protein
MSSENESIRRLAEDYESDYDDAGLFGDSDYESFDERFGGRARFRASPRVGGAQVNTGTGPMPVRFQQPVASAAAIERLKQDTQRAISEVRANVVKLRSDTDKRLKATNDRIGAMQQNSMLTTLLPLLQPPPKITSITLPGKDGNVEADKALMPTKVEFERPDIMMMLLPLLLGGGLGGGGGGTGQGAGQNDTMLLTVALMAMNKGR